MYGNNYGGYASSGSGVTPDLSNYWKKDGTNGPATGTWDLGLQTMNNFNEGVYETSSFYSRVKLGATPNFYIEDLNTGSSALFNIDATGGMQLQSTDSFGNQGGLQYTLSDGFGFSTNSANRITNIKNDNVSVIYTAQMPDKTGTQTFAMSSDITALSSVYMPLAGGTFVGNVNGVTPTELNYVAGATSNLQNQINNINLGLNAKGPARVMSDVNVNLALPGTTIDSILMAVGESFVANGQSIGSQNGVYVYNGSAVPATRRSDCTTGGTGSTGVLGMTITIEEGTYADQIWMLSTNAPITIGVTILTYIKSSNTTYTSSNGILLTGNNFTFDSTYFAGDVTFSGLGVTTIGSNKVTNAMLRQSVGNSVIGRSASSTGNVADISASGNGQVLSTVSSTLGFNTIATVLGYTPLTSSLTTGNIWVGDSGVASSVTPSLNPASGVFGISSLGAFTFPDATSTSRGFATAQLVADEVFTVAVNVSNLEINNMFTTPKALLSAPGANKILTVLDIACAFTFATAAFATNTTLQLRYVGTTTTFASNSAILTSTVTRMGKFLQTGVGGTTGNQLIANAGIEMVINTGAPTGGGTSSLIMYITYKVSSI